VLERTNLRHLDVSALRAAGSIVPVDLVTADLSFISLAVVAPSSPDRSSKKAAIWSCS